MAKRYHSSRNFFFLLSGENPELAVFEFKSVLSTLDVQIDIEISPDNRVIDFHFIDPFSNDSAFEIIITIIKRTTMAHFCCENLFQVSFSPTLPTSFEKLTSLFQSNSIRDLTSDLSFSVVTKRIGEPVGLFKKQEITQDFSAFLGSKIQEFNPQKVVDLENPDEKFMAILSEHGVWFGKFLSQSLRNEVRFRTSHKRPFFHPSSMNPILQRTMVNLAALKPGEWLLDPFCGTGGALIESSRLGIQSVGVEIDRRMIWGAGQNLGGDHDFSEKTHLVFGDATKLCFKTNSFSAIVTDPPYGTAASTQGLDLTELLKKAFQELYSLLKPGSRVVFAVPSDLDIEDQVAEILKATYKIFFHYVHRSLTRKILIFKLQ